MSIKCRPGTIALAVTALLAAPVATAEGWSIGLGIGESELDDFCDLATGISCDDTDTGTRFFAGYDLNENFRIEGFWVDLGEVDARNSATGGFVEAESDGIGIALMPMLPASDQVDVFGKIGLFRWDSDLRTNAFGPTESFDDDGTDLLFGGGVRLRLGDRFSLRGEWEQFELDDEDVTLLSVGGELRF